ncbi:glycosyltransferase [Peribacillus simplex]|uniref:glycosyltransferase n=1 Tax=Peribacillus simplex TaxID=1478 RepID=UPI003D2D89A8
MKTKILFVTKDLGSGGAEKSLASLLSQLDYNNYEVDLLRLGDGDFFLNSIPSQVNVLEIPLKTNYLLCKPARESVAYLLKNREFLMCFFEIISHGFYRLLSRLKGLNAKVIKWKLSSVIIPQLDEEYDVAIGYNYDFPVYFIVDKVKAKKKIGWVHGNYMLTKSLVRLDQHYFSKLDNIVTISEICKKILVTVFPQLSKKMSIIENIISPAIIEKMADQDNDKLFKVIPGITIVTVARLSSEKGIDMAVEAFNKLHKKGYNIKWFVIGEGIERNSLETLINKYGLEERFLLLGEKSNPYSYIKQSDIYVQPSRTEGKALAIEEAKVLGRPIVVTNYSTVTDQIQDGCNGLIVPLNSEGIYKGISQLIDSIELREKFSRELLKKQLGNEDEVQKLYQIIN